MGGKSKKQMEITTAIAIAPGPGSSKWGDGSKQDAFHDDEINSDAGEEIEAVLRIEMDREILRMQGGLRREPTKQNIPAGK